jgi:hypothetical protein
MSAEEPARWSGVNLQKATEQAFSDTEGPGLPKGWRQFFSCACTPATTCLKCEEAIDEQQRGPTDPDWDR